MESNTPAEQKAQSEVQVLLTSHCCIHREKTSGGGLCFPYSCVYDVEFMQGVQLSLSSQASCGANTPGTSVTNEQHEGEASHTMYVSIHDDAGCAMYDPGVQAAADTIPSSEVSSHMATALQTLSCRE